MSHISRASRSLSRALALSTLMLGTTLGAASAHATLEIAEAPANAYYKATIRIGHGCDGEATETLTVDLPNGFLSAKPMPKAGWTLATVEADFERTYELHGHTHDSGVTQIRWTGGSLDDGHYDEFVVRGRVADLEPGSHLPFKVVQSCANGEARWDEVAATEAEMQALDAPAPVLTVLSGSDAHAHRHGLQTVAMNDGVMADGGMVGMADDGMDGTATVGDLVIEGAWTRQAPPGARVVGGYARITNNGAEPDRLIGGSVDFAERVEVHEMTIENDVMRMNALADGLEIAPGETVELRPGSFHLMFIDVETPKAGDTVDAVLRFERAGEVSVRLPVAPIGATSMGGEAGEAMDHSKMGHGGMKDAGATMDMGN